LQFSNPVAPQAFENELSSGSLLFFHPPTSSEPAGADTLDYHHYFKGKKRTWELRVEFHLKKAPEPGTDMFFGIELEDYVRVNPAMQRVMAVAVAAVRRAVGAVYHSIGDDPSKVEGECEKPTFVLPMWAFDQFIETPDGQEPPKLTDVNFPQIGQHRSNRVKEYAQEIDALTKNLRVGPTYSFAFWGSSRFTDLFTWRLTGIPLVTPVDLQKLAGAPPLHAVLYSLEPSLQNQDSRHLAPRKNYYFKAAIWPSLQRPKRSRFEALTGAVPQGRSMGPRSPARTAAKAYQKKERVGRLRSLSSRIREGASGSIYCCTARTSYRDVSVKP
jgi:hypothetical protein